MIRQSDRIAYMVTMIGKAVQDGHPQPVDYALMCFGAAFRKDAMWRMPTNDHERKYQDLHR